MAEGIPTPPPEGTAPPGTSSKPAEQQIQVSAPEQTQRLDAGELAAQLEKAGLHTLAENMRQPTESDEEIAQRHSQEIEARIVSEKAKRDAEAAGRSPSVSQSEDKTQYLDLHGVADLAEQQKKHALAAELREIANKPPTT